MNDTRAGTVLVQVVPDAAAGREIGWGTSVAEQLEARMDDIRQAIESGANAVAVSLVSLPDAPRWRMQEVTASFGITLTAEAGVLLSKASAGATFEVAVTFERLPEEDSHAHDGADSD
jgi:hypothetical protein